jgi:transcription elongation GreA/GreB family factor
MDKNELRKIIVEQLNGEIGILSGAAQNAHAAATHEENIARSKYETFALEASYIAQGQANRAMEIQTTVKLFEEMEIRPLSDDTPIMLSALVTYEDESQGVRTVFICPGGGGLRVDFHGREITVISGEAPLTKALLGLVVDDEFVVNNREYVILSIY